MERSVRFGRNSTRCPSPPVNILRWLDLEKINDNTLTEPPLLEEISVEIDRKFVEAKEKLENEWRQYLENNWHDWAVDDRKKQVIQKNITSCTLFTRNIKNWANNTK